MKNSQGIFFGLLFFAYIISRRQAHHIGAQLNKYTFIPVYSRLPGGGRQGKTNIAHARNKSGIYIIKENDKIVYVGHSAGSLYKTALHHFGHWHDEHQERITYVDKLHKNDYSIAIIFNDSNEVHELEKALILEYRPRDNKQKLESYLSEVDNNDLGPDSPPESYYFPDGYTGEDAPF